MPEWYHMIAVIIVNKIVCSPSRASFKSGMCKSAGNCRCRFSFYVIAQYVVRMCAESWMTLKGEIYRFMFNCHNSLFSFSRLRLVLHNIMTCTKNGCYVVPFLRVAMNHHESCIFTSMIFCCWKVQSVFSCSFALKLLFHFIDGQKAFEALQLFKINKKVQWQCIN